jgi:peroxiredoxin
LIDSKGTIKKIWHKVKIGGHVDQVLLEAKKLFQLSGNES